MLNNFSLLTNCFHMDNFKCIPTFVKFSINCKLERLIMVCKFFNLFSAGEYYLFKTKTIYSCLTYFIPLINCLNYCNTLILHKFLYFLSR